MENIYPECTRGIVNRVKGSIFGYQAWGTLAIDENGTLYAVASGFRVSHICPFGKTVMYISKNEGKTWSPPIVINDSYLDDRDAGILYLGNGKMLVSWFTHSADAYENKYNDYIKRLAGDGAYDTTVGLVNGYKHLPSDERRSGSYVRMSEDYGMTWSEPVFIPITAPHGPTLCRDGSLIYLGVETYEEDRVTIRENLVRNEKASLYRSVDGGYTWKCESRINAPDWFDEKMNLTEPHVLELSNGTILGAFRVDGVNPFTFVLTESTDGGKTWSDIRASGISGSPPHLMQHSSGAVICSYGRRESPAGERAVVSYDFGKTWTEDYILHNPADGSPFDLGYPSTVELPDGSLITVYYQRCDGDTKPSILYTKWKLNMR